jgi:hypothetical protein
MTTVKCRKCGISECAQRGNETVRPSAFLHSSLRRAVDTTMLDDKGAVKAERLGLDDIRDEIAKSLATVEFGAAAPLPKGPNCIAPISFQRSIHGRDYASDNFSKILILIIPTSRRHKTKR